MDPRSQGIAGDQGIAGFVLLGRAGAGAGAGGHLKRQRDNISGVAGSWGAVAKTAGHAKNASWGR